MKHFLGIWMIAAAGLLHGQINYAEIKVDEDNFDEFSVFGDSLDPYKVYFTGENHQFASFNTRLEFKLLTYLHQTQGVKHFIFEQSPGVGFIIEEIIIDGKRSNLHFLKDVFYDPFYQLVKDLQHYNDSLAPEDKIHIHGIDVERFPYFSIYALNEIVDTINKNVYGGEVFEQIQALKSSRFEYGTAEDFYNEEENDLFGFGELSAWGTLSSIIKSSNEYRDSLKIALGENEEMYYSIIESLERGQEWYASEKVGDVKSPIVRERFMKDEFERIYRKDENGKFYGQFGRCHTQKDPGNKRCYDYYMNSIASRINDIDQSTANKVMVIPIFYTRGQEKFDEDIVKSLNFEEQFSEEGKAFIIDLAYKNGDHPIVGFYDQLPFIIVSNKKADDGAEYNFSWNEEITEFHLGAYAGYHYFGGVRTLNNELYTLGANGFTNKLIGYTGALDIFTVDNFGTRFSFTYYPEVNNGDRFEFKGWTAKMGNYYAFGNRWWVASFGLDYGYGMFTLSEFQTTQSPNLIQTPDNENVIIYRNDRFSVDPNLELRLTLPFISLNIKSGYDFDLSGKRWRLDGKMKNFTKTSFSAPYLMVGVSLNYKSIK